MYCKSCGKDMGEDAIVCHHCGTTQTEQQPQIVDRGGFGWGLLGCCIPVVGLVLFLVWRDTKPRTSKVAGIGALISVICCALFYVFLFVVGTTASIY